MVSKTLYLPLQLENYKHFTTFHELHESHLRIEAFAEFSLNCKVLDNGQWTSFHQIVEASRLCVYELQNFLNLNLSKNLQIYFTSRPGCLSWRVGVTGRVWVLVAPSIERSLCSWLLPASLFLAVIHEVLPQNFCGLLMIWSPSMIANESLPKSPNCTFNDEIG